MIRIASFNVRYSAANDGLNSWPHRRNFVIDIIRKNDPDLLGAQECLPDQLDFCRSQLSEYNAIATHRQDGKQKGEAVPLFVRRERFDTIDSGTFWLSETPHVIASKGWDADLERICTWARIRDREDSRDIVFLNTHFDHRGEIARVESAKLIGSWIEQHAKSLPIILTGDFNADGDSTEPHSVLRRLRLRDTWRIAHPQPTQEEGTYHAFTGARDRGRIDWIFVSHHFDVARCTIDYANRDNRYPSDHFPVIADLRPVSTR